MTFVTTSLPCACISDTSFPILSGIAELPIMFLPADRPIASIAFHAQGELLAVASGHKVKNRHSSMFLDSYLMCYDGLWLTLESVLAIYMALQQERGHILTNHCSEDTPFASGSAFSSTWCPFSIDC